MKDNSIGLIIIGIIGFIALVIVGKWMIENNRERYHHPRHEMVQHMQPQPQQPAPVMPAPNVIVVPAPVQPQPQQPPAIILPPQYPHHHPSCHGNREFWLGYRDGYSGVRPNVGCPEYNHGFQTGMYDRSLGRPYYYNRYWREPGSGFSLRIPGFSLNIR